MFLPVPNPVAFSILGLSIRWYGICIALGMLLALAIAYRRAPLHDVKRERVIDILLITLPLSIIGARLYYVLFHWDYYQGDFFAIINLRAGGLAIHGGLIVGAIVVISACYAWRVQPLNFLDLIAPCVALAQSIGRWGNYFNQEAYGSATNLPWAISVNGEWVHPTFLYESIWCFLLFFVLVFIDNRSTFNGQTFFLYGILYSLERFFVEGLRTDSLMLGSLKAAQVVSLSVFVIFVISYLVMMRKHKRKSRMFY